MVTLTNASSLDTVLVLPFLSKSILYRPYLEPIGSETILEWFLRTYQLKNPSLRLHILVSSVNEADDDVISAAAEVAQVNVLKVVAHTRLQALTGAARLIKSSAIAVISLGYGFGPSDLLERAFRHHAKENNDFTYVTGFPDDCSPEIYSTEVIRLLGRIKFPFVPSTPRDALAYVCSFSDFQQGMYRPRRFANRLAQKALHLLTGCGVTRFRSIPFDALTAYKTTSIEIPGGITFVGSDDVEVAARVIHRRSSVPVDTSMADLAGFMLWKQVKHELDSLKRRHFLGRLAIKTKRTSSSNVVRVLYVSNASTFTVGQESLLQLVASLNPERYTKYALIGQDGHFADRLRHVGATVMCPNRDFTRFTVNNVLYLLDVLKKVAPDTLHFNGEPGMPALVAATLLGIPFVQHLRVARFGGSYLESLKTADALVAISEFVKREAYKQAVISDKIHVVYNGIDISRFQPGIFDKGRMRQEFNIPVNAKVALMVARFVPSKRHDVLLKATRIVRELVPSFYLTLVGDDLENPVYYEEVNRQISEAGLGCSVSVVGFQRDIRRIEAVADMAILCSDQEPLGRFIMEAMAMGIPVVVTAADGKEELVENEVDGFIVGSGGHAELARRMILLCNEEYIGSRVAKVARETIQRRFSIERHAREIEGIYEQVVAKA